MNRSRALALVLASAAPALLAGCITGHYPGGGLASQDKYVYESTPDYPQSVVLVNVTTGEKIWSVDVPVGRQLVIQFHEDRNEGDSANPDIMNWQLMEMGNRSGSLDNAMPVPASWSRRIDVFYRKPGEAPGATASGG